MSPQLQQFYLPLFCPPPHPRNWDTKRLRRACHEGEERYGQMGDEEAEEKEHGERLRPRKRGKDKKIVTG